MKSRKKVKAIGLITLVAMCILVIAACSKEGDGTTPLASSDERATERSDQANQMAAPDRDAVPQKLPAAAMDQNQTGTLESAGDAIEQAAAAVEQGAQGVVEQTAETAASAIEAPITDSMEIQGTVLSTEGGYVLFADTNQYQVLGKNLSAFVDKNVKVTGTLEELGDKHYIHVSAVELIETPGE